MSKNDKEKYKPSLIYTSLLKETSKVRMYGINKYGDGENWTSTEPERHFDAAIRHIRQHADGEQIDKESGQLHLAHAITNLMFEIERLDRKSNIVDLVSGVDINNSDTATQCKKCGAMAFTLNSLGRMVCSTCRSLVDINK